MTSLYAHVFLQTLLTQQVSYKSKLSYFILRYVLLLILETRIFVHKQESPPESIPYDRVHRKSLISSAPDLDLILVHMYENDMVRTITRYYKWV